MTLSELTHIRAVCIGGPCDGQVHAANGPQMSIALHPDEPLSIAGGVDHYGVGEIARYYALCWRAGEHSFDRFVWVHNALTRDEAMRKMIDFYGNRP